MVKIAINGRFVVHKFGGQERYSYEIIRELDKIAGPSEFELIVPEYADNKRIPKYKNIEIKKVGSIKGHFWEQISFYLYLKNNKRIGLNTCITCPILKPDIVTIHDISQIVHSEYYNNLYGKLSTIWHKLMFWSASKSSRLIFTVSEFSKSEIIKHLNIMPEKIVVTGNGWQHFNKVQEDKSFFEKQLYFEKGNYFLSASSITPQKNFKWIKQAAINNPNEVFVIVGAKVGLTLQDDGVDPKNLYYLGFVDDGEMKALMRNCKAFIHPAKYEGFGITPMEAMSVGAPIILSNVASLPEIYSNTVRYIDPEDAKVDLNEVLKQNVSDSSKILQKYTWEKMARILYEAINKQYNLKKEEF